MNPTHPSGDNPYQTPATHPLPPDPEHWRLLRRQLRATALAEQRRALGWGSFAFILLFSAVQLWPERGAPLLQQLQDRKSWPALTMIFFALLAGGLFARHLMAAAQVRRRVAQLERDHPESAPDFFSTP